MVFLGFCSVNSTNFGKFLEKISKLITITELGKKKPW
jgi:hypothetical protein